MLSQTEIDKYGGKAAILNHIRDNTDLPVPPYVIMQSGQSLDSILGDFNAMQKPVIVRSSSPYEYGDFEGIFKSVRDVKNRPELEYAIQDVQQSARSERAKQYAEQHGFKIGGDIHLIVQEQTPSFGGGMLRHPNNPDLVFITYFKGRGKYQQYYYTFLFDETIGDERYCRGFTSHGIEKEDAQFLVEQYKKIEGLEQIADDSVLFVEFGFNPFAVYQARPFMKKQVADFKLPDNDSESYLRTDFVFGVTSPEGICLPIMKSVGYDFALAAVNDANRLMRRDKMYEGLDEILRHGLVTIGMVRGFGGQIDEMEATTAKMHEWYADGEHYSKGNPYCLMIGNAERDPYDLDLMVPNMRGLVIGQTDRFLVHNLMRLFKRSDITLGIGPNLFHTEFYKDKRAQSIFGRVRLYSNGKEGVAILEEVPEQNNYEDLREDEE
jgi:hypothetical protein